jgi:hypothetical protein
MLAVFTFSTDTSRFSPENICQSAQRDISPEHVGLLFSTHTISPDSCLKLWTISLDHRS